MITLREGETSLIKHSKGRSWSVHTRMLSVPTQRERESIDHTLIIAANNVRSKDKSKDSNTLSPSSIFFYSLLFYLSPSRISNFLFSRSCKSSRCFPIPVPIPRLFSWSRA